MRFLPLSPPTESPPLVTLQVAGKSPTLGSGKSCSLQGGINNTTSATQPLASLQPLQDGLQAMARNSPPNAVQVMPDVSAKPVDVASEGSNDVKINGNHLAADAVETTSIEAGKDLLIDQLAAPSLS